MYLLRVCMCVCVCVRKYMYIFVCQYFFVCLSAKIAYMVYPKKYTHITPILQSLHWLQVRDCIVFKILLLIFHCLKGSAPHYNISLVHKYTPVRPLRSSNSGSLVVPKSSKTWGERAFAHAGPNLWNKLPLVIKNSTSPDPFKSNLKTHLLMLPLACHTLRLFL